MTGPGKTEKPEETKTYIEDVGPDEEKKKERPAAKPSSTSEKADLSADVVPRTGSTGSIEVTDRKGMKKEGLPKDVGAMVHLALDVMEKNKEKNKDSVAYNAVRGALLLYSKYFGFAMTPGSFSMYIDSAFFNENFEKEQMEQLWINTYKKQYAYWIKKYDNAKDDTERAEIEKKIGILEKRLYAFEKEEFEKIDDYRERLKEEVGSYEQRDEIALDTDELDKFKDIDDADPYISTYYVSKELGALNPSGSGSEIKKEYDPERLYANLMHSEYQDKFKGTTQNLYDLEESESNFRGDFSAGTLPAGTIVFFNRFDIANGISDRGSLISGIVGMDGKIRYQTKNGLEVYAGFDAVNNDLMDLLQEFQDNKGTVDWNDKTKGIIERSKTASVNKFMGAFIPNIEEGDKIPEKTKEEEDAEAKAKDEATDAATEPDEETKPEAAPTEAAEPAEEPAPGAAPATEAKKAETEPEAKEKTKKEE
ncbi:hypothetical protein HOG17_04200 [Candidatus Peregrinibacteria bacterium]|jgi:hypothetical protein|nr:hypothetical protein [Candidatus Peregrinibacteria bacterium]MBT4366106.1 hypothetical protein [Candidatus Peregrinibacteria bacterium]MBT4456236.1 hypothetical protein [Candidatus Peregrinibacteria bacterium]